MRILLLAGEESGVLYANQIRAEILRRWPEAEIRGYDDYGFKVEDLAVIGFAQVFRKIFYFLGVKKTMELAIEEWKPDVVCTVDYPGLNLKLAAYAKARGIRAVHVVCPQVWAWKRGRIPKIEAALDRLCCFFPFEPGLFKAGVAEFVGHPLVESFHAETQRRRECSGKTLALLPGSRMGEIEKHMPVLLEVVRRVGACQRPVGEDADGTVGGGDGKVKVVIPAANEKAYRAIASFVSRLKSPSCVLEVRRGGAREVLRQADAAVVASGTATLEAALAGCPTVLVYRVGWLFAIFARLVIKGVKHLGLANIIAEKAGVACPMPELLQENFTVENILHYVVPWLKDESANAAARQSLAETMKLLRSDGGAIVRIVDQLDREG